MSNHKLNKSIFTTFLDCLSEAEHVLKYSLYLGTAINIKPDSEKLTIDTVSDYFEKLSNSIFNEMDTFTGGYDFNFFGYKGSFDSTAKENADLSILCNRISFWRHALKQNSIISAFVRLRKLIGESYSMSQSERAVLSNYTFESNMPDELFDQCNHGFDYLTTSSHNAFEPWFHLTSENQNIPHIKENNKCQPDHTNCYTLFNSNSTNFKRRINKLADQLKEASINTDSLFLSIPKTDSEDPNCLLSVLEFFDFTVKRSPKKKDTTEHINEECSKSYISGVKPIINGHNCKKVFTYNNYKKYMECTKNLLSAVDITLIDCDITQKIISKSEDTHKLTLSDRIYLRYQIEKIFAPSTINCLYQNIFSTKYTLYDLSRTDTVQHIASCLCLPNVFTRQYILQMAIDTISKHYDYNFGDSDFFTNKLKSPDTLMTYSHSKYNHLNHFDKLGIWMTRYRNMISFLTQLLFPIHDNCFFCSLWNAIKNSEPDISDADTAIKMYQLLRDYLNNKENVSNLFDTETVIMNHPSNLKNLKSSNIIKSCFIPTKIGEDISLYKDCLTAHTLNNPSDAIPEFINLSYLNKIGSQPQKQIQNIYILESSIVRR